MVIRLYTSEFVYFVLHELQMAVAVICFGKTNSCFNPNHLNLSFHNTDSATLLILNMKGLQKRSSRTNNINIDVKTATNVKQDKNI